MGYIETIGALIQAEARVRGYKICSTAIAQAVLENGHKGESQLASKYHNHHGLKCGRSWAGKSVNLKTKEEYTAGNIVTIRDNFRVFDSMADGVKGYYDFISKDRYKNLRTATTARQYAEYLIQDGYATDKNYVNKVCSLVEKYNLTEYDKEDEKMRDIAQLHPVLQAAIYTLKNTCLAHGLHLGIGECLRTAEEQDALYAQGRTKPGKVVTNAKGSTYSSQHQWGIAFDFFKNIKGHEYDDIAFFNQVGALAKQIGLGWGGDWTSPVDKPHLYLKDWGSTTAPLKAQYKTPEAFMKTWGGSQTTPAASNYSKSAFLKDLRVVFDAKADDQILEKTVTLSSRTNKKHSAVKPVQKWLNQCGCNCGTVDGIAGPKFTTAVKKYQKEVVKATAKNQDGIITAKGATWKKMLGA